MVAEKRPKAKNTFFAKAKRQPEIGWRFLYIAMLLKFQL